MKTRTLPFALVLGLGGLSSGCSAPVPPPDSPRPSGATVVYSTGGSALSAVGTDGSAPVTLADDAAFRATTADGWVVFVRGETLLSVRPADGAERILDDAPGTKWFRAVFDTNYLVYQRQHGARQSVHLVRADGTDRLLPVPPQERALEFVAITPARRLLYQACDPVIEDGEPRCLDERLLSVGLDGSGPRRVLSGRPFLRHVTADDLLVYDRPTEQGSVVSAVTSDGRAGWDLSQPESFFAAALPNGRIVYNRREYGQLDLYSVATDATDARALATSDEDEFYAGAVPGDRVLFLRGGPDRRRLYIVDEATGNDLRALQDAGDSIVRAVQPDGTIVFSTRFDTGDQAQDNLYSIRPDGTGMHALADSSDMEWFEGVAADGRVVYMRCIAAAFGPCGHPSAQSDLYSVRQDATGLAALAVSGDFEVARAITRGNVVVYGRRAGEQWDLYGVATTGGAARPLATTGSDERFLDLIEPAAAAENPG